MTMTDKEFFKEIMSDAFREAAIIAQQTADTDRDSQDAADIWNNIADTIDNDKEK